MITPKIKHITPPEKARASQIIRQTIVRAGASGGGLTLDQADSLYRRLDTQLSISDVAGLESVQIARELILSSLSTPGWIRLGTIDSSIPRVLRFDITMIRGNEGKSTPSEYRLAVSANSGGSAGICYFGAQLNCVYGDDYDGTNDDPLLAVALVRRSGYGPRKADLLIHHEGTAFALCATASDPSGSFTWDPAPGLVNPGTGDDVTIAKRRILMYA